MTDNDHTKFAEICIPVPWGTIAGRWYGDQTVRPILTIHGWLDNCGTFATLAPLLAPHVSLLCIDLPGHGHSSHLPAGMIYADLDFVRTIARIMELYNWQKVALMGHSMGGGAALQFAAIFPQRVDFMICLDIVKPFSTAPEVWSKVLRFKMKRALIDNERLMATLPSEPPSYAYSECERRVYEGSRQSIALENCKYILERNVSKSRQHPNQYYFSRDGRLKYLMELNPNEQLLDEMAQRICSKAIPFLEINGGASTSFNLLSGKVFDTLRAHNPHFELRIVAGGTHYTHLNQPHLVAEMILHFLHKYRPADMIRESGVKARL